MVISSATPPMPTPSLTPEQADALLTQVRQQLDLDLLDPEDPRLQQQLMAGLGDLRPEIRLEFCDLLASLGEDITPLLTANLAHHPNPTVRQACATSLMLLADPMAVPDLVKAVLEDSAPGVRSSALGALAKTGEASVPALLAILADPEQTEVALGQATWAIAFIGSATDHHRQLLYRQARSPVEAVRAAVIGAIASMAQAHPDATSIPLLLEALGDPSTRVRCAGIAALSLLQPAGAIAPLIQLATTHPDWETRKAAAIALIKFPAPAAIAPLQSRLATEPEEGVRAVLELAIRQLQGGSHPADALPASTIAPSKGSVPEV